LLAGARVARLATRNRERGIDLVPVTFALVDGDTLVSAVDHKPKTTTRLARLANIERDPDVTLLADHYDDEDWNRLWWVRVNGRARVLRDGAERDGAIDALVRRYRQYLDHRPDGPAVVVHITRWRAWAASDEVEI
jgi:PPOX class probable F420-dependent enzyme